MDDAIGWLIGQLLGESPAGSFWDFITGSGRDSLSSALELVLKRPQPDFSTEWFMNTYNRTFYLGLLIGVLVQVLAAINHMLSGNSLAALKALVIDFLVFFLVAFSLPAIATLAVQFTDALVTAIVSVLGGEPEISWFEQLLSANSFISWQSVLYGVIGALLLIEVTLISLLPYMIIIAGPGLFAARNLGSLGRSANRALWGGLAWSQLAFIAMVTMLCIGNWLLSNLPVTFFVGPGSGDTIVILVTLGLVAVIPLLLVGFTRKNVVRVENKLQGQFQQTSGTGYGTAVAAGSAIGASVTARRLSGMATSVVQQSGGKSAGQLTRQVGTQVAMAAARSHPIATATTLIGSKAVRGLVKNGSSQQATPPVGSAQPRPRSAPPAQPQATRPAAPTPPPVQSPRQTGDKS